MGNRKSSSQGGRGRYDLSPGALRSAEQRQPLRPERQGPIFPFETDPNVNTGRLDPAYTDKLIKAWQAAPPGVRESAHGISGYRPATEAQAAEVGGGVRSQEAIIRDKAAGKATGAAAPVGASRHGTGRAMDFARGPFLAYLHKQGGQFGLEGWAERRRRRQR
jgi:hypothetical protein